MVTLISARQPKRWFGSLRMDSALKTEYIVQLDILPTYGQREVAPIQLYGIRWYTGNGVEATKVMATGGVNTLAWGFNVRCRVQDRTSLQQ